MNCRFARPRLVAYQDHELSPAEHARVRDHLAVCKACRRKEAQLARITPSPVLVANWRALKWAPPETLWETAQQRRYTLPSFQMPLLAAAALAACSPSAPPPPPKPHVSAALPLKRQVVDWDDYVGRFEAVQDVEIRPRISGTVESVNFREGVEAFHAKRSPSFDGS